MFRYNPDLKLVISEASETPVGFLWFNRGDVVHDSRRPVITDFAMLTYRNTAAAAGSELTVLGGSFPTGNRNPANVRFHGFSVNNEVKGLPIRIDGGRAGMLGLRTERGAPLVVTGGADVEVLGATFGVKSGTAAEPAITVEDARLTLVANKSADAWPPERIVIRETRGGQRLEVRARESPPRRKDGEGTRMIPLYR